MTTCEEFANWKYSILSVMPLRVSICKRLCQRNVPNSLPVFGESRLREPLLIRPKILQMRSHISLSISYHLCKTEAVTLRVLEQLKCCIGAEQRARGCRHQVHSIIGEKWVAADVNHISSNTAGDFPRLSVETRKLDCGSKT